MSEECKILGSELQRGKSKDILLIFIQEGCPYCKSALEYINTLEFDDDKVENLPDIIMDINIDTCGTYGYDIEAVPTFIRIRNNKVIAKVEGFDKEAILWILTGVGGKEHVQ